MAPDLVIAANPYALYPGGVIALRAVDYMGGARGTLSSGSDAQAVCGQAVTDTQQVTSVIRTANVTAFGEAEDTLSIPFIWASGIPFVQSQNYRAFISAKITGDLDLTSDEQKFGSSNLAFLNVVRMGSYGFNVNQNESSPLFSSGGTYLRNVPHYLAYSLGTIRFSSAFDDFFLRVYSQTGSTIEWHLDQIVFLPIPASDNGALETTVSTFELTDDDGDDGGDDNGEFTVTKSDWLSSSDASYAPGGADYQRKDSEEDAEYTADYDPDEDGWFLADDATGEELKAYHYSLHNVRYRPQHMILEEDFNRTVGPDSWGVSPEGYDWLVNGNTGPANVASGGIGLWTFGGGNQSAGTPGIETTFTPQMPPGGSPSADTGLSMRLWDDVDVTAEWRIDAPITPFPTNDSIGSSDEAIIVVDMNHNSGEFLRLEFRFQESLGSGHRKWSAYSEPGGAHSYQSATAIPSYNDGDWIGVRIKKTRYRLRIKVWNASAGSEPGTWDVDDFIVARPASNTDYPYSGNADTARQTQQWVHPAFGMADTNLIYNTGNLEVQWRNIVIQYDSEGDPENGYASMSGPDDISVGEITIPYGAPYFVNWGLKDWTSLSFGDPYLDFKSKVWNDVSSAVLQRTEHLISWFRTVAPAGFFSVIVFPDGQVNFVPATGAIVRVQTNGEVQYIANADAATTVRIDTDGQVSML